MPSEESAAWRAVFAALANETSRVVYADIVRGAPDPGAELSPSRRRRALDSLVKAGLIVALDDGWGVGDVFTQTLAAAPRPQRRTGVARFLTADGMIDRYPSNQGEREELLRFVAEHALTDDEVLSEQAFNERLARFSEDTAVLRRYLVDFGIVERTASGSEYARAAVETS